MSGTIRGLSGVDGPAAGTSSDQGGWGFGGTATSGILLGATRRHTD
jgi:hypothetical protein